MRKPKARIPDPTDSEEHLRVEAVRSVVQGGGPEAVQMLADALVDPYAGFRKLIAESLVTLGPQAVPSLVVVLADSRPDVRRWSAELLGRLGDTSATGPLLLRLTDSDSRVRAAAAEALGNLADRRAAEPLIWMSLNDAEGHCRESAVWALRIISKALVQPHIAALGSSEPEVRQRARDAVCGKGRGVVLAVIDLLKDDNPVLRQSAAEVLRALADERALVALTEALRDRDEVVRDIAARALSNIKSEQAVKLLIANLASPDLRGASDAAHGLVSQGTIAVPALLEALASPERDLSVQAAEILGRIRDDRALNPLLEWLDGPESWMRATAARALGDLGNPTATSALTARLPDPVPLVRAAAAEALGDLRAVSAAGPLLALLKNQELSVRIAAIRALGRIGSEASLGTLIELLTDTEIPLRIAAVEALGDFRDIRAIPYLKKLARSWPFGSEPAEVRIAAQRALAKLQPKFHK